MINKGRETPASRGARDDERLSSLDSLQTLIGGTRHA